jgi:hypothetical protein
MPNTKGTDVVSLRKIFQGRGQTAEGEFLAQLSPELKKYYQTVMHATWSSVEQQTELYEIAARVLFPNTQDALVQLGRAVAGITFNSVYRFFLKIPTVGFVVSHAPSIWHKYYDTGEAVIENLTKTSCDLIVKDFPSLPRSMRELTCGHLAVILEIIGVEDIQITLHDENPQAWRWHTRWK